MHVGIHKTLVINRVPQALSVAATLQAVPLVLDLGNPAEVIRKLQALPQISHVFFFAPEALATTGDAASDLKAGLESFQRLVSAARSAGCSLRMTQFNSGDHTRGEPIPSIPFKSPSGSGVSPRVTVLR